MAELCEYQTFAGTYLEPPEYCILEVVEGESFCEVHLPVEWCD